jgi:hypothetical protein
MGLDLDQAIGREYHRMKMSLLMMALAVQKTLVRIEIIRKSNTDVSLNFYGGIIIFMEEEKLMLSVRLRHPSIQAEEIINNIKGVPVIARTGGKNYITPFGKKTNRINKETYVVYDFPEVEHEKLPEAIKAANIFLFRNINYFDEFKKRGGRCDYYITLDSKNSYAFTLEPELIMDCTKTGIEIGVEVFAKKIRRAQVTGSGCVENLEQRLDNIKSNKSRLYITFEHASMSADEIVANIDYMPFSKQTARQKFTPPYGKSLEDVTNKRTFVVYKLPPGTNDELEYRIEMANAFLSKYKPFLKEFYAVGGSVRCSITIISKKHYIFELPSELIQKTAELGAKLEVEIYAEVEEDSLEE